MKRFITIVAALILAAVAVIPADAKKPRIPKDPVEVVDNALRMEEQRLAVLYDEDAMDSGAWHVCQDRYQALHALRAILTASSGKGCFDVRVKFDGTVAIRDRKTREDVASFDSYGMYEYDPELLARKWAL